MANDGLDLFAHVHWCATEDNMLRSLQFTYDVARGRCTGTSSISTTSLIFRRAGSCNIVTAFRDLQANCWS
jgi:hypothetical protein